MKFQELDLDDSLLDALHSMHFEECTPIQEKSIPHLLEGKDVVGIAQTGTGKTEAYLPHHPSHTQRGNAHRCYQLRHHGTHT